MPDPPSPEGQKPPLSIDGPTLAIITRTLRRNPFITMLVLGLVTDAFFFSAAGVMPEWRVLLVPCAVSFPFLLVGAWGLCAKYRPDLIVPYDHAERRILLQQRGHFLEEVMARQLTQAGPIDASFVEMVANPKGLLGAPEKGEEDEGK